MIDREKVIKGLAVRIESDSEEWNTVELPIKQAEEILALLKEPVPYQLYGVKLHICFSGAVACGVAITDGDKFCRNCGKAVRWE